MISLIQNCLRIIEPNIYFKKFSIKNIELFLMCSNTSWYSPTKSFFLKITNKLRDIHRYFKNVSQVLWNMKEKYGFGSSQWQKQSGRVNTLLAREENLNTRFLLHIFTLYWAPIEKIVVQVLSRVTTAAIFI